MEEVLANIFNRRGGLFWTHNVGLCLVLNALGYAATLGMGIFAKIWREHPIVFVKSLTAPNSLHIADVGFASMSPKAISLDF